MFVFKPLNIVQQFSGLPYKHIFEDYIEFVKYFNHKALHKVLHTTIRLFLLLLCRFSPYEQCRSLSNHMNSICCWCCYRCCFIRFLCRREVIVYLFRFPSGLFACFSFWIHHRNMLIQDLLLVMGRVELNAQDIHMNI